jgi:drug/metabolite transporter (DMT)-like permease
VSDAQAAAARTLAGISLVLVATVFFAITDTAAKYVTAAGAPILMALWARYTFQAIATTLVVVPMGGWSVMRTRRPLLHALRGLTLVTSSAFVFLSLKFMSVGEFTAIMLIAPLVLTWVAGTFLKEHVSPLRWALVSGGFIGTLVIIRPGGEAFTPALLLPLAQVATNCGFQVLTIRLARTENPLAINFYTGWVGALAATPLMLLAWEPQLPPLLWALLVGMGVSGAAGHFLLILAYRRAPASTLTPYQYAQIGFAMGCGWLVFGHVPDGWSLLGMGLIALCGAAGAWLTVVEHRQALRVA